MILFGLIKASDNQADSKDSPLDLSVALAQANRANGCGEFGTARRLYGSVPKDSPLFFSAAVVAVVDAVGLGDAGLIDQVLADVRERLRNAPSAEAKRAAEMFDIWLRWCLKIRSSGPEWLDACDLVDLPPAWQPQGIMLMAFRQAERGEFVAARALASVLLNHMSAKVSPGSQMDVYLKLLLAETYRDEGEMARAAKWCREAVLSAKARRCVLPFFTQPMGPKSALGLALQELAPEFLPTIRRQASAYFRNLVRIHNRLTGESASDLLTPREFYVTQSLVRGCQYKEIAMRLGIAYCRVNELVSVIYNKLDVHNRAQLMRFVW